MNIQMKLWRVRATYLDGHMRNGVTLTVLRPKQVFNLLSPGTVNLLLTFTPS